jgi:hypothetical protein
MYLKEGGQAMSFEELKSAVLSLSMQDQKRFVTEVMPVIWPKVCADEACVNSIRQLVDEDTIRKYKEEHIDHF